MLGSKSSLDVMLINERNSENNNELDIYCSEEMWIVEF
jgi:hypothetical protein